MVLEIVQIENNRSRLGSPDQFPRTYAEVPDEIVGPAGEAAERPGRPRAVGPWEFEGSAGTEQRGDSENTGGRTIVEGDPTHPGQIQPSSGGSKSRRPRGTMETSSVGPHWHKPRSVVASRIREPLFSGHGYSPAMTSVLMIAPPIGSGRPPATGHSAPRAAWADGSGRTVGAR